MDALINLVQFQPHSFTSLFTLTICMMMHLQFWMYALCTSVCTTTPSADFHLFFTTSLILLNIQQINPTSWKLGLINELWDVMNDTRSTTTILASTFKICSPIKQTAPCTPALTQVSTCFPATSQLSRDFKTRLLLEWDWVNTISNRPLNKMYSLKRSYLCFFLWKTLWLWTLWIVCHHDFKKVVKPILQLKLWVNRLLGAGSPLHHIPAVLSPPLSVWTQAHVCWYAPSVSQLCCLSLKKGPDERSSIPPHPSSSHSCHLLFSLSALTAWLTPFPLSAPRYNVNCHQGPFYLRQDPAAGCPVVRAWAGRMRVILSGYMEKVRV